MEFVYIFRILSRRKWSILAIAVIAVIAAFLFTLKKKPVYKSVAQMSTGYTLSEDMKLADEGFNVPQIDVKFNNAIENITSAKVLSLLSYRLLLHDLNAATPFRSPDHSKASQKFQSLDKKEVSTILQGKIDSITTLSSRIPVETEIIEYLKFYEYDVTSLLEQLYVGRHQRTDYIDIVFRSENPDLSAFVVNNLCEIFQYYFDSFRRQRALEAMVRLDSMVKIKKRELDQKTLAKTEYLRDSVSGSFGSGGVNYALQLQDFQNLLVSEEARVEDLKYNIKHLEERLKTTPSSGLSGGQAVSNNSELLELRRQYHQLYDKFVQGGASDKQMESQLDELNQKMLTLTSTSGVGGTGAAGGARVDVDALQASKANYEGLLRASNIKIAHYRSKIAQLTNEINKVHPTASAKLDQFDKEIEFAELEYTSAKEKLNTISNEGTLNNFKQTLYGQPAIEPEPARRIIIMGLSGASAIVLASLAFVFAAYIDQSIKTPSQFYRQTGLKLLGVVNLINFKRSNLKEQVVEIEAEYGKRDNAFRELLRKLRYEIENSDKRVILFTSTEPQQGKTTLVQALAFSLSLGKKKVLILDTNFCNNDLTELNKAHPTLEAFSGGDEHISRKDVEGLITDTGVPYVDIIGCKGGDYTPSEILPRNHLLNYMGDLLEHYDFIFMEGAPLNGYTDSKELAHYADGVLAIFSASIEVKQSDKESIQFLKSLGNKFMGAVLNKVDESDINL